MAKPDVLLETKKFRVVRESLRTPAGQEKTREIVRHPGACVMVPLLDDGRVCLIRNYRVAVGQTLIEIPAGTLEPPEPPEVSAHRELIEETGYRAAKIDLLNTFFPSPGILDEKMYLYLATGLTAGPPAREETEEIENLVVSWSEALRLVTSGEIHDAKTIVGILWVDRLLTAGHPSLSRITRPPSPAQI
jgi:ADP-ribose pyrophosphatase